MNTTALQSMISALKVTRSIASEMGAHFADFIEPIAEVITSSLIHLKLSMTVRQEATRMCSALIFSCPTNQHKQQLLRAFMPHIAEQIHIKLEALDFRSLKWLLKEVSRCIKNFENFGGAFLEAGEASALIGVCLKICETVQQDKKQRIDEFEKSKAKMDEDEIEEFWENVEKMDRVWGYFVDITGVLLRNMADLVSSELLHKVYPHYRLMVSDAAKKRDYELIEGTCFLVDCLELGNGEILGAITQQAVATFSEILQTRGPKNPVLCQNCIFGLGEYARRSAEFPHAKQVLEAAEFVLAQRFEDCDEQGPFKCYDNAVSTVGKLIYFQGALVENLP